MDRLGWMQRSGTSCPQHHPGLGTQGGTTPSPHGFLSPPPLPKPALAGEEGVVLIPGPREASGSLWIPWQQPRLRTSGSAREAAGTAPGQQDSPALIQGKNPRRTQSKRPICNTQELGGSTSSQIFQEYQRVPELWAKIPKRDKRGVWESRVRAAGFPSPGFPSRNGRRIHSSSCSKDALE